MLPDEESIYPPPVLRKDIMKLQLFMGCFARKRVRHDSTNNLNKKYKLFCKKCLTIPCGSGIVNKLSQGIAFEMLKNKIVFRKFKLTVDNRLNL